MFGKNKYIVHLFAIIILASCSTTSENLQTNSSGIDQETFQKNIEEIYNYQSYFPNDLVIIQKAIDSQELNPERLRDAKLLKKNYQKIISKDEYLLEIKPSHKYSGELIELIYKSNLPISISWNEQKQNSLPENLLSTKINDFCASLYDDSIASINKELIKSPDPILVIYSQEYLSYLKDLQASNQKIFTIEYNSNNFQEFSADILGINLSNKRFKKISNLNPNQNLKFTPRPRADLRQVVILLKPKDYKAMIPALRYHGGNKFKYITFISSLEELNDPLQLLDYEDTFTPISIYLSNRIKLDNSLSIERLLEKGVLSDWLFIQALKQAGVQSATINSVTGKIFYKSNSCAKREIPLQKINSELFSS